MQKEYKLTIYVTYAGLKGAEAGHVLKDYGAISSEQDAGIRRTLAEAVHHLASNGLLSEGLDPNIEVATWSAGVTAVDATTKTQPCEK